MTIFTIKIIACITMILDHIKYAIPSTRNFITLYFGRISFPLFAFLITEGYIHTSNLKKYYSRIVLFAIISQIPFMLFRRLVGDWKLLNIMFTLLLGLIAITIYDKQKNKFISLPLIIGTIFLGEIINVDYGWYGVATVILIYILKDKKYQLLFGLGILSMLKYVIIYKFNFNLQIVLSIIFTWLPSLIMCVYNGKQGKKVNFFFYLFYPVHMILLVLLTLI